jgi:methyl-accepting chemotaxis protein
LSEMSAAMINLAKGNFSIVLPGLGRADEIGEIAQAVESLKVTAEQKARDEAEAKLRQDQIAAGQRKQDMIKLADSFESAVGEIVETVSAPPSNSRRPPGRLPRQRSGRSSSRPLSRQRPRKPPPMCSRWPPPPKK